MAAPQPHGLPRWAAWWQRWRPCVATFDELGVDGDDREEEGHFDEMTGAALSSEAVHIARQAEFAYDKSFDAFVEVDDRECYEHTGRGPTSCRWKDINKGDDSHPEVRSRLIAREIKRKGTGRIFVGTPPSALLRFAVSRAATRRADGRRRKLMTLDAERSFLHADAIGKTFVLPPHLRGSGRCWLLKKCVYGILPSGAGW